MDKQSMIYVTIVVIQYLGVSSTLDTFGPVKKIKSLHTLY